MTKPQKISIIGPVTPYRGGIAHFTTSLALQLSEHGHDLQIISFKKQYPGWLYPGDSDKDHSPGRVKVDAQFILKPLDPISWRRTVKAILDFPPQQVIIQWWVTFWGPAFHTILKRLKRRGIPVTVMIHNTLPHEPRPWDRFLAKKVLSLADRCIVMTEKEKARLLALIPDAPDVRIAPLPIDTSIQRTGMTKSAARQKLGSSLDQKVILFFGFIRPYKGLAVLIDAFKIVSAQEPTAQLWVVGEFWEDKHRTLNQVKTLGLEDRVHFTDRYVPDDEVGLYFEAADLFVAPYTGGTQSAALRTALAFGLPVVLTDVIRDKLTMDLPQRCSVVKAADDAALAKGILDGLQITAQDQAEIEALIDHSWKPMITAVTKLII